MVVIPAFAPPDAEREGRHFSDPARSTRLSMDLLITVTPWASHSSICRNNYKEGKQIIILPLGHKKEEHMFQLIYARWDRIA